MRWRWHLLAAASLLAAEGLASTETSATTPIPCKVRATSARADPGKCSWADAAGKVQAPDPVADAEWFAAQGWAPRVAAPSVPLLGRAYPVGRTVVEFVGERGGATKGSSGQARCVTQVVVTDAEAPRMECESRVRARAEPGKCAATVSWSPPNATDNCGSENLSFEMPEENPAETPLPVGLTQLTYTARDRAGNRGSCDVQVEVVDVEKPVLTCPLSVSVHMRDSVSKDTCQTGAVAKWSCRTSDNCGKVAYSCDPPSGSAFAVGNHAVVCNATDTAGNVAQTRIAVEVFDITPPRITCPQPFEAGVESGKADVEVRWQTPTATDNSCKLGSVRQVSGLRSGNRFPIGTHDIEYTVKDGSGHTSACSFKVTVSDQGSPSFGGKAQPIVPAGLFGDIEFRESAPEDASSDAEGEFEFVVKKGPGARRASPSKAKSSKAKSSKAKPSKAKPSKAKPGNAKPSKAKPGNAKPGNAKPGKAKPSKAKPGKAKPSKAKPGNSVQNKAGAKLAPQKGGSKKPKPQSKGKSSKPKPQSKGKSSKPKPQSKGKSSKKNKPVAPKRKGNVKSKTKKRTKTWQRVEDRMRRHCPSDIVLETLPNSPYGVANFIPPVARDASNVTYSGQTFVKPGYFFPPGETVVQIKASDADENSATCSFKVNVFDKQPPLVGRDASLMQCPRLPNSEARAPGAAPFQQCGGVQSKVLVYQEGSPIVMKTPERWSGPTTCCRPDYNCVGTDQFKSCLPRGLSGPPLPHDCGGAGYSTTMRKIACDRPGQACIKQCSVACAGTKGCVGFAAHDGGCGSAVYEFGNPNYDVWCPKKCPAKPMGEDIAHMKSRDITGFTLSSAGLGKCRMYGSQTNECLLKSYIAPISSAASYSLEWDCYEMKNVSYPALPTDAPTPGTDSAPTAAPARFPTAKPTQPAASDLPPEISTPTAQPTWATDAPTRAAPTYEHIYASGNGKSLRGCYSPSGSYNERPRYVRADGGVVVRRSKTDSGWDWCPAREGRVAEPCELSSGRGGFSPDLFGRPAIGHIFNWNDRNYTLSTKCPAPTSAPTNAPSREPTSVPTSDPTAQPTGFPTPKPTTSEPTSRPTDFPTPSPTRDPTPYPTRAPTFAGIEITVTNDPVLNGIYHQRGQFNKHPLYVRDDCGAVIRYGSTDNGWDFCHATGGVVNHVCSGDKGRLGYLLDDSQRHRPLMGKVLGWGRHWGNGTARVTHYERRTEAVCNPPPQTSEPTSEPTVQVETAQPTPYHHSYPTPDFSFNSEYHQPRGAVHPERYANFRYSGHHSGRRNERRHHPHRVQQDIEEVQI